MSTSPPSKPWCSSLQAMLARGFDHSTLSRLDQLVTTTAYQVVQQRLAAGKAVRVDEIRDLQTQLITGRTGQDPQAVSNHHVVAFVNAKSHSRNFPALMDLVTAEGLSRSQQLQTALPAASDATARALARALKRADDHQQTNPMLAKQVRSYTESILSSAADPAGLRAALSAIADDAAEEDAKSTDCGGPTP